MEILGWGPGDCAGDEEGMVAVGGGEAGGDSGRDAVVGETADGGKKAFGPSSTTFACLFGKSFRESCNGWSFGWAPTLSICFRCDPSSSALRPCCFKMTSCLRSMVSRSSRFCFSLRSASLFLRNLSLRSLRCFIKSS